MDPFAAAGGDVAFLLARVLFGGVLAFMGVNHFMNMEDMVGYAEMKGAPAPGVTVPLSGAMLLIGGLLIAVGAYPALGALLIVAFMAVVTPLMHDFWAVEDPQQQQTEMTQFLKNVLTLGAALVFYGLAGTPWPYAVGGTLF